MDQIIQDLLCNVKKYLTELTDSERFFALKEHTHIKQNITDFVHGNESHSETYITEQDSKDYTDDEISNTKTELQTKINGKSKVTFLRSLNSGNNTTQIGTITIDGISTDIYCEKDTDTTYTAATTKPKADAKTAEKGTSTEYARADHVHPTEKSKVSFSPTLTNNSPNKVKIGAITIDGTTTEMFCQNTVYSHPDTHSASMIEDSSSHSNIGSASKVKQDAINTAIDDKIGTINTTLGSINTTLNNKVDKETGKGLSTYDFNETYKSKLESLQTHPTTHPATMITDSNAHSNIGSLANDSQSTINTQIDTALGNKVNTANGKGLSTNDFNNDYKDKVDAVSSYAIYLDDKDTHGQNRPDAGLTLEVDKSQYSNSDGNYGKIYAYVKKNKNTIVSKDEDARVVFVVNGVTYVRKLNEEHDGASLNIRLNSKDINGHYIQYTVIAMFVKDGWTEAIDIKSMLVFDSWSNKINYNNTHSDIVHN